MVSHVRVRLVNGSLRVTDARRSNGLYESEGLIDGEACPREVVNGSLRVTDARMSNGFGCARG